MIEGIEAIIFDLGGVILNIDYQRPIEAFKALGAKEVDGMYSKQVQTALFDELETGSISEDDFWAGLSAYCPPNVTRVQLEAAWNSILLDFPLRRLQILQQVQLHYSTYLLSNTNSIHERAFNALLQQTVGYPSLAVFFDKVYMSHRVGLRKPDPAIFELVLRENRLTPQKTLFIDDSPQHIAAAQALGIQTIHLTDGMTLEETVFRPK
jgi:putative hydrolase of the HAD superfamily